MRILLRIVYWLVAIVLLAVILTSLDYTLGQAILIGLIFCPCALALEFWMPKAQKPMDKVYLSLAVMTAVVLLIVILHYYVWSQITPYGYHDSGKEIASMLINPAFLGLILTALAIGDFFWAKWTSRRFEEKDRTITFFSERRGITLHLADIAYVESNDTEVRIITVGGESYRNKTGIGQWENLLGYDFLRIHRSYLVNTGQAKLTSPDTVSIGETELPISRKYKESVLITLAGTEDDKMMLRQ
ncbi:MAG: LytTR family transcriptional regulator [Bacteroidales bacterium]|nr:LytTR family transcriptional regulator [Bacteroidales bacterium]